MTLWGATAQSFPDDVGSAVVAFKGVQVHSHCAYA
jgi:hypothetical protein